MKRKMLQTKLTAALFALLLAPPAALPVAAGHTAPRPNIVLILADDLGCGDMSLYDGWIKTPRIDQMAREGVRFTDFHSNSSVCSPTRAAFLTGRYQQRVGIIDVIARHLDTPGLEATELTIPRLMKQNGYRTALFGKWHLGDEPRHNPIHHGFDEFVGFLPGGGDYHKHGNWMDGTEVKDQKGYSTHIITDRSVDFIKAQQDQSVLSVCRPSGRAQSLTKHRPTHRKTGPRSYRSAGNERVPATRSCCRSWTSAWVRFWIR